MRVAKRSGVPGSSATTGHGHDLACPADTNIGFETKKQFERLSSERASTCIELRARGGCLGRWLLPLAVAVLTPVCSNKAIDAILRIGNLSNRQIYQFEDHEARKIIRALKDAIAMVEGRFQSPRGKAGGGFKL
jgi:hypothetical protein